MRDHGVSVESAAVRPGSSFPLPGADALVAAWMDVSLGKRNRRARAAPSITLWPSTSTDH